MGDILGWAFCAAFFLAWFMDISVPSDQRERLTAESHRIEEESVADYRYEGMDHETLTAVKMIRLRGAWQRLVFALTPRLLCKMLVAK